jgi:hypothetical protein
MEDLLMTIAVVDFELRIEKAGPALNKMDYRWIDVRVSSAVEMGLR